MHSGKELCAFPGTILVLDWTSVDFCVCLSLTTAVYMLGEHHIITADYIIPHKSRPLPFIILISDGLSEHITYIGFLDILIPHFWTTVLFLNFLSGYAAHRNHHQQLFLKIIWFLFVYHITI